MIAAGGFSSTLLALSREEYLAMAAGAVGDQAGNNAADAYDLTWGRCVGWCVSLALFGFFVAIPLRKKLVVDYQLLFPSGTAAAHLIQNLNAPDGAASALAQWTRLRRYLGLSFTWSAFKWAFTLERWPLFGMAAFERYGWETGFHAGYVGTGLIMPLQVSLSMLLGAVVSCGVMAPYLQNHRADYTCPLAGAGSGVDCVLKQGKWYNGHLDAGGSIHGQYGYKVFTALSIILVDAVMNLVKVTAKIICDLRAPAGNASLPSKAAQAPDQGGTGGGGGDGGRAKNSSGHDAEKDRIFCSEAVPARLWLGGLAACGALAMVLLPRLFDVTWYMVFIALLCAPPFSVGIIYGTGLTDHNLASAVGKLAMFAFGPAGNGSITPALVMCGLVISVCSQATDLMQDFKAGYLVRARPRAMLVAQLVGALFSSIMAPSLFALYTRAFEIPGPVYKARAALVRCTRRASMCGRVPTPLPPGVACRRPLAAFTAHWPSSPPVASTHSPRTVAASAPPLPPFPLPSLPPQSRLGAARSSRSSPPRWRWGWACLLGTHSIGYPSLLTQDMCAGGNVPWDVACRGLHRRRADRPPLEDLRPSRVRARSSPSPTTVRRRHSQRLPLGMLPSTPSSAAASSPERGSGRCLRCHPLHSLLRADDKPGSHQTLVCVA